jgi:hypothetical protein
VGKLENRVSKLEQGGRGRLAPSRTQLEVWAIDAEIRELEREMKAHGEDPNECLREARVDVPLDEHIAILEVEIEREEQGRGD